MSTMSLTADCGLCQSIVNLEVQVEDWLKWAGGEGHVQDIFPYLSDADRELLISRTCGPCWDSLFPEEDEDE